MSRDPWVKWYPGDYLNGVADMSPEQGWVYTIILNRIYDEQGPITLDVEKIARRCNMRPTTCLKQLDALIADGKLIVRDGLLINERCEKEIKSRQKVAEKSSENAKRRWDNQDENHNENNDCDMQPHEIGISESDASRAVPYSRSQNIDSSLRSESSRVLLSDFGKFYAEYPRKVGKGAAQKAYQSARKTTDHETIMAGLERHRRQLAVDRTEAKFIPHPATWLNGQRWSDEVDGQPPAGELPLNGDRRPFAERFPNFLDTHVEGWVERVGKFWATPGAVWPESVFGPAPDQPDTRVPIPVRERYVATFGSLKPGLATPEMLNPPKPEDVAPSSSWDAIGLRILKLAGLEDTRFPVPIAPVKDWLDRGWTEDAIMAGVRAEMARPGYQRPKSLKDFETAIAEISRSGELVPQA